MARGRVWLIVLPLLIAGSASAHAVLGRIAPAGDRGAELFERAGTGSGLVPALLSVAVAAVIGGANRCRELAAWSPSRRCSPQSRPSAARLPMTLGEVLREENG